MTVHPAFHLPPGTTPGETVVFPGERNRSPSLLARFDDTSSVKLLDHLEEAGRALRSRPVEALVAALGRVGGRFLDPADPLRREAELRLPREAGVSAPMGREIITGMARDWTAERLAKLVRADFPDPGVLDELRPGPEGSRVRALGGRLAFHIGAGNVPGVCATSAIRSLLVKCPLLLKPGRDDVTLPCLFARGLAEEDAELATALAVVYWPREEGGALEAAVRHRADRVVVYGGSEVVAELRRTLPPETPLVAYHHRVSMGAVGRDRLGAEGEAGAVAEAAASAVAVFDQRGCVSPSIVFTEAGGAVSPRDWAERLARELDAVRGRMPPGPSDPDTAARVQHLKGTAELRRAAGSADEVFAAPDGSWTVLYEPDPRPPPLCPGRTVHVKPLPDLAALPEVLAPFRSVLQSFSLETEEPRRTELSERLGEVGISRVTGFEAQAWPPPWWRHDGSGPLEVLVRWLGVEPLR